jgi:hypothetical protein
VSEVVKHFAKLPLVVKVAEDVPCLTGSESLVVEVDKHQQGVQQILATPSRYGLQLIDPMCLDTQQLAKDLLVVIQKRKNLHSILHQNYNYLGDARFYLCQYRAILPTSKTEFWMVTFKLGSFIS